MEGIDRCRFKDACHLTQALILGDLEVVDEAFLPFTGVPGLCPIGECREDEGVVDLAPVEEVKAPDGVAEEGDSTDGGPSPVCHDGDMVGPIKSVVKVDAEVSEGLDG